ncbi:MAG: hypothetical protein M3Y58_04560 [Chloroflexota bacterium]|nr:hypothetical protein [Chloroflexota bacterium]
MPRASTWMRDPGSGSVPIPPAVRTRTKQRLQRYAAEHLAGRYTRLDVRFRGALCYIDAFTEPEPPAPNWPPPDWHETREEMMERLRATPIHLCRLRYCGDEDRWGFAFYTYSANHYERAMFPSGDFFGSPEDALQTASLYL